MAFVHPSFVIRKLIDTRIDPQVNRAPSVIDLTSFLAQTRAKHSSSGKGIGNVDSDLKAHFEVRYHESCSRLPNTNQQKQKSLLSSENRKQVSTTRHNWNWQVVYLILALLGIAFLLTGFA